MSDCCALHENKTTNTPSSTSSTMSIHNFILRTTIILVLCAAVLTVLYLTPMPDPYFLSCNRPCHDLDWPMICRIKLNIEIYQTMSSHCNSCLTNTTKCSTNSNCIIGNGFSRAIITANRQLPGPSIHVCKNDIVVVDVINKIPDQSVTIHWRGQTQEETPFMDGTPMITQCPILGYTTFQYKFRAAVPGTHLWEAYSESLRANGLFGALIVRQADRQEPHQKLYDFDENEHVFIISGWSGQLIMTNWFNEFSFDKSDSLLINGNFAGFKNFIILLKINKRYRFRMAYASASNLCPIRISIKNHILKVIAMDGHAIMPEDVEAITLNQGERIDFILKTDKEPDMNHLILIQTIDCDRNINTTAFIRYESVNDSKFILPTAGNTINNIEQIDSTEISGKQLQMHQFCEGLSDNVCVNTINAYEKMPILLRDANNNINTKLYFVYETQTNNYADGRFGLMCINNITFTFPSWPLLTQTRDIDKYYEIICDENNLPQHCQSQQQLSLLNTRRTCECTHVTKIPRGHTVELILFNAANDSNYRIFHLHGYNFWIVGVRKFSSKMSLDELKELDYRGMLFTRNLINPVRKDTIAVPKYGVVAIRFIADNPGYWILRETHNLQWTRGGDVILQVGDETEFVKTPSQFPTCGNFVGPDFFLT